MIMSSSSVTTSMAEFDIVHSCFILAGFMASKNADLIFWWTMDELSVSQ